MTDIRIIITDMNDTYPEDMNEMLNPEEGDSIIRISCKDIPGKNMYCTDEAFEEIGERLSNEAYPAEGLHFIDTGNYHYMSRVYTSFIRDKYDLILFDHHTDMQCAGFGDILSCGSWALEALEKDENLSSLYVYGPLVLEEGGEDCKVYAGEKEISGKVYRGKGYEAGSHPVYLSVDKDILSKSECITNWDQGDLSISELETAISSLCEGRKILGADICGGISESDPGCSDDALILNMKSDVRLYGFFRKLINGK